MKKEFLKCGLTGWCMEIFWTSLCGIKKENHKLIGQTSVWMFPIYGMASFIKPVSGRLKEKKQGTIKRGIIYTIGIYIMEFTTGTLLKKKNRCPWDYSNSKYNINGVIRLDYAPLWFAVGLIYEKMLLKNEKGKV